MVFKSNNRILELKPKVSNGYLYDKALKTIEILGLGNCEEYRHENSNIHNCRISILSKHFIVFYKLARALKDKNKLEANLEFKQNKELFKSYGFYEFIKRNQFDII